MKKYLLLAAIILQTTFLFGQQQWSNWVRATCNQGIQGSAINYGYNQYGKGYEWNWKVKNTYSKTVTFDLYFKVGNDKKSWGVFTLAPGEERKHVSFYYNDASPSFLITVENVFFGTLSEPNSKRCWAECDNGSPVCNVKDGQNNSNTTTQTTTQQNDLTEYNRSKAEMEAKLERENAEIQRQNQENANKLQLFNNAIKAGVAAHNSGNYTEAKRQFTIALNNSTNENNRQMAQGYYNKSIEAEKSQTKIKAVGDFTVTAINAIDQFSKANRERKIQKEKNTKEKINNIMKNDNVFNSLVEDLINTFEKAGYKLKNIGDNKEDISISSTISKTQTLYFEEFELFIFFSISENEASSFGAIKVISDDKEKWEKIRDSKILKKWEKNVPKKYRFENAQYKGPLSGQVSIEFENKLFKTYKNKPVSQKSSNSQSTLSAKQLFEKGEEYNLKKDYQNSLSYYEAASEKGSSEAMVEIGILYREGKGVTKNYTNAMNWFLKAEKYNNTNAMQCIAYLYLYGRGVAEDAKKTLEWLLKAADKGDASAMSGIGALYHDGELGEEDYEKAFDWYKKAADKGNADAMEGLGDLYFDGNGVEKNINKAIEWYQKSANNGNDFVMLRLGIFYRDGKGVEKNLNKAKEWFIKACNKKIERACENLNNL